MKFNSRLFIIAVLTATVMLLLVSVGAQAKPSTEAIVSLSVSQTSFETGQDVMVQVTISNPTLHTIRVLKWLTPVDGVVEEIFSVTRNGEPISYIGPIYKRPSPASSDYVVLKSGASFSRDVPLAQSYDLSSAGDYSITYAGQLKSNSVDFKVSVDKRPTPTPTPPPGSGNAFVRCTVDQQTTAVAARAQATIYSEGALKHLATNNGTLRYTTWFGVYTSTRDTIVTNHFTAITDAFQNAGITYNCGCKQPYYAYVYANKPYEIYLCKYFWLAPMTGTDSKAGTLIHEMSHFTVVAGTDDFVYGQTGAMQLAIDAPDNAVMNADNHEYFAENTPSQP